MPEPSKPKPTPESETKYEKLSPEGKRDVLNDLKEYLRLNKAFKAYRDVTSGNSTKQ
jgi:hypothetical protein